MAQLFATSRFARKFETTKLDKTRTTKQEAIGWACGGDPTWSAGGWTLYGWLEITLAMEHFKTPVFADHEKMFAAFLLNVLSHNRSTEWSRSV